VAVNPVLLARPIAKHSIKVLDDSKARLNFEILLKSTIKMKNQIKSGPIKTKVPPLVLMYKYYLALTTWLSRKVLSIKLKLKTKLNTYPFGAS
tara:strand:+ start:2663 stop:2941 length:279 start_codon:yes stop_codon:yes gene_type:complete